MLLEVSALRVQLGESLVLDGTSLQVEEGEVLGIVGPNGAGKSTLFAALSGFVRPVSGWIALAGENITSWSVVRRARAGLVRTFQVPREFRALTVVENLAVALPNVVGESIWQPALRPARVAAREREIAETVARVVELCDLGAVAHVPAGSLSGGQKKLLELARAMMGKPRLLLLDEPFNGVNPVMIERISAVILALKAAGTTIVIIEHNLQALKRLVARVYVMDRGTVLAQGSLASVLADAAVQAAYLGKAGVAHA